MDSSAASRTPMTARLWEGLWSFRRSGPVRCDDGGVAPIPTGPTAPTLPQNEPPTQFEMFSKEWKQLSEQDNFDGFRIEAWNSVNKNMQACHTLFLGTQLRPEGYLYQFGPQFLSENGRTMLYSRIGLDRAVSGRIIQKLGSSTEFKLNSQSHLKDAQRNMQEFSLETSGEKWAASAKFLWQGAPIFCGAFSQRVTPGFSVGGDLMVIPVNGVTSIGQLGVRYAQDKDIFAANIARSPDNKSGGNQHEVKLQYVHKVSTRLSLGTEYKLSVPDKESGLTMGYEYMFNNARIQGLVDSDGKVNCCVNDASNFGFSGSIDYARGDYKFGAMMNVMPPPEGQ